MKGRAQYSKCEDKKGTASFRTLSWRIFHCRGRKKRDVDPRMKKDEAHAVGQRLRGTGGAIMRKGTICASSAKKE